MTRWLCPLLIIAGLLMLGPVPSVAQEAPSTRLATKWLRVDIDSATGAIIGLAADPSGSGDFSHPLAQAAGSAEGRDFGIFAAARGSDTEVARSQPSEGFGITSSGAGATIRGLRIGEGLTAELAASLSANAPELTLRAVVRAKADTEAQWAGLLLALDPKLASSTIYFADRQGLASIATGRLTVASPAASGAICKDGAERSFTLATSRNDGVEIDVQPGRIFLGIASGIGGAPPALRAGASTAVEIRLTFGWPRVPGMKEVTSKFQPAAQDFIFWSTHVATTRRFGSGWMQETASIIDPGLPAAIQQAYRRCWLRDVAHGWKSGVVVAGPDMLAVMRDEITAFAGNLNEGGQPPTNLGPDGSAAYGNLDSAGLLIGMIYDYFCRTGDIEFVGTLLPQADKMGMAIAGLVGPRDLPVIGEDGDTYPDLGFVKGEQTYLTAVCCDGMRKLARLHEILGESEVAGRWHLAANRVSAAANRTTDKGGLWDAERGVYIGWRKPDGSLYRDEDSFANLWAIDSGVCDDGARVRSIFARLNDNWQRYYLDGLCPTALSIVPYPNGLNQWVPWAGGWDVYLRARLSEPRAQDVWRLFLADYERTDFPYREASGYRQTEANTGNRGRIWDSWGFLQAVYGGHYGIEAAPAHIRILPRPIEDIVDDGVSKLPWRDAVYNISLRGRGLNLARVQVDGNEWASCVMPVASGEHQVTITSTGTARKPFVLDCGPMAQIVGAAQVERGLAIEASVPSPGRHWFLIQWPDQLGPMRIDSFAGADFPQIMRLSGERAALVLSVPQAGKFGVTLVGSALGALGR
jgi:hypothetical protein